MINLPGNEELCSWFASRLEEILQENNAITQIPAPSWDEHDRSVYVADRFRHYGLQDVFIDDAENVIGILPGTASGPVLMLAPHLDTVFPRDTDLTIRREGNRLYAPGIRDNSFGVTSLLWLLKYLQDTGTKLPGKLICVATAGEEGLGDLKGMKAAMKRFHQEVDYVIAIDGGMGGLTTGGITSRRYKVTVQAEGGHSYGAFGASSAVHSLGRMIAGIAELQVPTRPKTTYNVGVISGGHSVNSIAATADMLIDMRSEEREALMDLEAKLMVKINTVKEQDGIEVKCDLLGDRPGGATAEDHPLVTTIQEVQKALGIPLGTHASSTDANIPMSYGIPAVTMGCGHGGNAHRTDEWLDSEGIDLGLAQLVIIVAKVMELPAK